MTGLTKEGVRNAEFMISEANNFRSRDTGVVDATGAEVVAGTLLKKDGENFVPIAAGEEANVKAILWQGVEKDEVVERTLIVRDAEVKGFAIQYPDGATEAQITAANDALSALGIVVR